MRVFAAVIPLAVVAGCAKAGTGPEVRADIQARMETVQPTITSCYADALREDRKLAGLIVLRIVAAPGTGAFADTTIVRDDLRHQALQTCVLEAVTGLTLATPQKTAVTVDYPLDFAPNR